MNDEQYKRYCKMTGEAIECLYQTNDRNGGLHFLISGSTGTRYKVTIHTDGKIDCGCPDFKHNSKSQECICKHCLFVIFQVLHLFKDVNHTFFERLFFTPDEIQNIQLIYKEKKKSSKKF